MRSGAQTPSTAPKLQPTTIRPHTCAPSAAPSLAAATALLWIRSNWSHDTLTRYTLDPDHRRGGEFELESNAGRVLLSHTGLRFDTPEGFDLLDDELRPFLGWRFTRRDATPYDSPSGTRLQKLGFYHYSLTSSLQATRLKPVRRDVGTFTMDNAGIALPHWALVMILTLPATPTALRLLRRQRLVPAGHCPTCGYDLRATPPRSPECGTIPAHHQAHG
jgi:hypothetical protein